MTSFSTKREDIASMMRESLDGRVFRVLELCGSVGDGKDTNTYVVGGFVRDLLIRRPNLDIDIVVEGDGLDYSHALSQKIKGGLRTYGEFGTATISSEDDIRIDVATARREVYETSAALPRVSVGNLKDDMFRRDFTINSMAISLNEKSFGELIDFFSGTKDLSRGVIRVLHDSSFKDDPTRIMRAIRFETRFGFSIDEKTERLLKDTLSSKMLELLTPERKRYELELLFSEERADLIADRMRDLGIFRHLARGLKCPDRKTVKGIQSSIAQFRRRLRPKVWVVYTVGIADSLPFAEAVAFGKSLALTKKQIQKIIQIKMVKPAVRRLGGEDDIKPSFVYRILKDLSPEALIYLHASMKSEIARKRLKEYVERYRAKKTIITGKDIKTLGIREGPIYTKILEEVLNARIDGKVETYEDEIELAKKIVEVS